MKYILMILAGLCLGSCSITWEARIAPYAMSDPQRVTFNGMNAGHSEKEESSYLNNLPVIKNTMEVQLTRYAQSMERLEKDLRFLMKSKYDIGYERGMEDGKIAGFFQETQELFRESYRVYMSTGEQSTACNSRVELQEVSKIAKGLFFSQQGHRAGNFQDYSWSLYQISTSLLAVINGQISRPPNNLEAKVLARYNEIHPGLATLLFQTQLGYLRTKNQPPYPDFSGYRSIEAFLYVYLSSLGSLLDAVYTEALADWAHAAQAGVKVFGGQSNCALAGIMPHWATQLYAEAMKKDLNSNKKKLESHLRKIFSHRLIETRKDHINAYGSIKVSQQFRANVDMEILTILNMRLREKNIRVSLDHDDKIITIAVPTIPKLLATLHHDYTVRSLDLAIADKCGVTNLPTQGGIKWLMQHNLQQMFRRNRVPVKKLGIYTYPFDLEKVTAAIKDDLQKVIEPYTLLLMHSKYNAVVEVDGEPETLLNTAEN